MVTFDGKLLIVGSGPLYGQFGGGVSFIDLEVRKLLYTANNIISGHTIQSVEPSSFYKNCVWLGTCPYGENTNPPFLDEPSHLVLWDITNRKILKDIIVDEQSKKLPCIVEREGSLYCVTQSAKVVCIDISSGDITAENQISKVKTLLLTLHDNLLGISDNEIIEFDENNLNSSILFSGFNFLTNLSQDKITEKIYCFDGSDLIYIQGIH
jgi:hypothetical protein